MTQEDLSRLGRNYLKTGELIEIVFPENGVRYIAINDGVDTAREDNEFTPLRNWFNEFYARDTSKKIRAVKQAQAQKGERVNGEYPYGYIPDPNNRHHLIPDPETAPIVKQVFAMFVSGVRMCEIQKWLAENKVLTIGALRYQRTGQARYQRAMIAPYTWPDKTLYDILARQEYLGHTITAKTHKVSYKSKKTRKNEEEQRYFFPNTHEPLVDEETFELAQKRIATRHRPTKAAEIDIFSGLLFCAGCRHKMYYQQGVNIEPRKFSYSCGAWRNRARTGSECTSHYIRKNVLLDLVLEDMRRVLRYVKEHEQDFICTDDLAKREADLRRIENTQSENHYLIHELNSIKKRLLSFEEFAKDAQPETLFTLVHSIVDRIYITTDGSTQKCQVYIKGCATEDYSDILGAAEYIDGKFLLPVATYMPPMCDLDKYSIRNRPLPDGAVFPFHFCFLFQRILSEPDCRLHLLHRSGSTISFLFFLQILLP